MFIYLTPEEDIPSDEHYIPLDYEKVATVIHGLLETSRSILGQDVAPLIEHYLIMLRRHIVTDPKIIELCQKIYAQHQRALDLIFEFRPDLQTDLSKYLANLLYEAADSHGLIIDQTGKTYIRFALREWDRHPELKMGEGWTKSGRILLFEFRNDKDSLNLWLEIGPGPQEIRKQLHQFAIQNPQIFRNANKKVHAKWTLIYKRSVLKQSDYESLDEQELMEKIRKFWDHFLTSDLPPMRESSDKYLASGGLTQIAEYNPKIISRH